MNILIVDRFAVNRDPAQTDMYRAMENHFSVSYCSTNEGLWLLFPRADVIFLGIYHTELEIDWGLFVMVCDKPIIIDNADNEEQVSKAGKIGYQWMKKKIFTSRYLPHRSMTKLAASCNTSVMSLPWYIDPKRVPDRGKKTNDIAFICTQYGKRIDIGNSIRALAQKNGWTCIVGEYYGPQNAFLLSRSRVSVIECERKCLTQKYIESALCRCAIVGDVPLYPLFEIEMYSSDFGDHFEEKLVMALNSPLLNDLTIFATESIFIENLKKVIDAVLLV